MRRTLAGDLAGFDELVERYQRRAVSASYRLVGNTHDAMEICQEAFVKAFRSLATLKEPERFGPWLLRIVSNLSLNFRRGRKTMGTLPTGDALVDGDGVATRADSGPGGVAYVEEMAESEETRRIQEAIQALPEKQRLALVLFAIEGWPQRDVAEVLNCSLEAVKWNVFQARKRLKDMLADST